MYSVKRIIEKIEKLGEGTNLSINEINTTVSIPHPPSRNLLETSSNRLNARLQRFHPRELLHILAHTDSHQRRNNPRGKKGVKKARTEGRCGGVEDTSGKVDYEVSRNFPNEKIPIPGRWILETLGLIKCKTLLSHPSPLFSPSPPTTTAKQCLIATMLSAL